MGAKRALIVDDSKSARMFLSRILEKYDLEVDSAESAEQAIEYLGEHRPDVIFMDHLMPGMDGFQAVQAIKNNPRTAMIPILMYTSQEGELYLGQARALGAVGVLPKQIKPTDVSKVLYQLHLVTDRRTSEQTSFRPVAVTSESEESTDGSAVGAGSGAGAGAARPLTDATLREHIADLRRVLVASLGSQSDRLLADLRVMLEEVSHPAAPAAPARRERPWGWIVAVLAVVLAAASVFVSWQTTRERDAIATQLAALRKTQAAQRVAAPLTAAASASGAVAAAPEVKPIIMAVPYGGEPLGGLRLEGLRQLFDRLVTANYHGIIEIRVFPGRFCVVGNAAEGFSLAPDELLYSKCDSVAVSPDEAAVQPQRVPLAFANLVGELRSVTRGALDVQVLAGDPATLVTPYPPVAENLNAGEWNRAANANARLEIRVR